ncbi:hypothetical protein ALI22I_05305 [Saccharothrix sp. ALI-22-I]|uniref:hypothetical protein n=1 Tax=Saccharothrix sp. ALI-22-I TaxID=1933778 RepID=UPI00097C9E72|nr:hypothetical protein [Saccharothrix sp. ALI-22-I]ONI92205.1 hypothetical protein ALI22I_05305 [Saccharothrix sp. ALI-22-I]
MNVALVSEQCLHCVEYDVFSGSDQVADRIEDLAGTRCLLCGATIGRGELSIVMDSEAVSRIGDGAAIWNRGGDPAAGYGGFFEKGTAKEASSGVARKLLGQLTGATAERRRQRCAAAMPALLGIASSHALGAEKAGDRRRARQAYQVIVDYVDDAVAAAAAIQAGQLAPAGPRPAGRGEAVRGGGAEGRPLVEAHRPALLR